MYNNGLDATHQMDTKRWKVNEPLIWTGAPFNVTVPPGFQSNLASNWRGLWFIIPPSDRHIVEASVSHDFLYSKEGPKIARKEADVFLRQASKACGAPPWYYWAVYYAVRAAGWMFFKKS